MENNWDFFSRYGRKTKIIGTIGPSSSGENIIRQLIRTGMDMARLNFSHGSHDIHSSHVEKIRRISAEENRLLPILQDLQGPKIRCGYLHQDKMLIEKGKVYKLQFSKNQIDMNTIPVDYKDLARDIQVEKRLLMDDGLLSFQVVKVENQDLWVEAQDDGVLKSRKGINFPDSVLPLPALTEKDSRDLIFGLHQKVDMIALSFVQKASDVIHVKRILQALGSDTPVIAKIEKPSAIEDLDNIAKVSDGLMVARGDLGVEGGVARVPLYQRQIIATGARYGIPVIIATQMLESMVHRPEPSNAELADIANGVLEGADALMLSSEVASGTYPVEAVSRMVSLIQEVEAWPKRHFPRYVSPQRKEWPGDNAIAVAACEAADRLQAKAILCLSLTGSTVRLLANWRPQTPIIAISPRKDVIQRLVALRGVFPMENPMFYSTDALFQDVPLMLKKLGILSKGDKIVMTAGIPIQFMAPTNALRIQVIP